MTSNESQISDDSYHQCLKRAAAAIIIECGFDSAQSLALESLTEMLQAFIMELGRSIHAFTELACRQLPLPADVLLALVEMGQDTQSLQQYAFRTGRKSLSQPAVSVPSKPPSILHTGDRKRHRPGGIIPENYAEFPDSHSYIRTPTHKQPITDYEGVREKAASQKRDMERALTRFIAKTGKTHSLFSTNDTNLFPLIFCDRVMPNQPILPPYIHALLFKDQIFEEDDRDYMPKKKKVELEDEDVKDDNEEDARSDSEQQRDDSANEENSDASKNDSKIKEETNDVVENPFMKPVRLPRNAAIKRLM